jgi:hypothetical protein
MLDDKSSKAKLYKSKRLGVALDELRAAVFEAYAAIAQKGAKTGTEQQRRESALRFIDEILEWRPLATFSAKNAVRLLARHRGGRGCSSPSFATRSNPVAGTHALGHHSQRRGNNVASCRGGPGRRFPRLSGRGICPSIRNKKMQPEKSPKLPGRPRQRDLGI